MAVPPPPAIMRAKSRVFNHLDKTTPWTVEMRGWQPIYELDRQNYTFGEGREFCFSLVFVFILQLRPTQRTFGSDSEVNHLPQRIFEV
jgi:hypothetical protein